MSYDAAVEFTWLDGEEHRFRLGIKQLQELQDKCKAGPVEIIDRLMFRRWRIEDVRETIRLGLLGGGMNSEPVRLLIQRYVENEPWERNVKPALLVLSTAVFGDLYDQVGKTEAKKTESDSTTPTTDELSFPQSMAPVQ